MATIEPRLIHLLNQSPSFSHSSLPPLQDRPHPKNSARPHPIEPDATQRAGDGSGPGLVLSNKSSFPPTVYRPHDEPLLPASTSTSLSFVPSDMKSPQKDEHPFPLPERSKSHSLRMILGCDVDHYETSSSNPLRGFRDEYMDSFEDFSSKKRHHTMTGKEDFPQLPHPLKKQKSSNAFTMPPIIQGLHQPPPNVALFPPISSAPIDNAEVAKLTFLRDFPAKNEDISASISPVAPDVAEKSSVSTIPSTTSIANGPTKAKRRAAKPRRKWSEEETNYLLLGVNKHGVGRWTDILEDSEFQFNERTAGDLKDRFRTCCPDELRGKKDRKKDRYSDSRSKLVPGPLQIESILDPQESNKPESPVDAEITSKPRKSRAHRKNMQDLRELGIHGPFKKSQRRERRPFTEQDDKEILKGFEKYGPQWTKIQRDPNFHLSHRQATDLRDRLRNKRPDLFGSSAKAHAKDFGKCGPLEQSVSIPVEHGLGTSRSNPSMSSLTHSNSQDDIPRWPGQTVGPPGPSVSQDWPEASHSLTHPPSLSSLNNDMGIGRLLLDDSQVIQDTRKPPGIDVISGPSGSRCIKSD